MFLFDKVFFTQEVSIFARPKSGWLIVVLVVYKLFQSIWQRLT